MAELKWKELVNGSLITRLDAKSKLLIVQNRGDTNCAVYKLTESNSPSNITADFIHEYVSMIAAQAAAEYWAGGNQGLDLTGMEAESSLIRGYEVTFNDQSRATFTGTFSDIKNSLRKGTYTGILPIIIHKVGPLEKVGTKKE